jgi:hypothetical protein
MVRILLSVILSLYVISASAAEPSCTAQVADKKLAGAAKTSFMGSASAMQKLDAIPPLLRKSWRERPKPALRISA